MGHGAGGTSGMWQGLAAGHGQVAAGSPQLQPRTAGSSIAARAGATAASRCHPPLAVPTPQNGFTGGSVGAATSETWSPCARGHRLLVPFAVARGTQGGCPHAPSPPWLRRSTGHVRVPITAGAGDRAHPGAVSVLPAQPRCRQQDPAGCPRCLGCLSLCGGPRVPSLLSWPAAGAVLATKRCHFLPLGFCRGVGWGGGLLLNDVCIFGAF